VGDSVAAVTVILLVLLASMFFSAVVAAGSIIGSSGYRPDNETYNEPGFCASFAWNPGFCLGSRLALF
jgi:hypothetical protein